MHHPFKAIGLKLISALLFAAMSALVRQLGDVAPVGTDGVFPQRLCDPAGRCSSMPSAASS
jgi:hypothetical protein